MAATYNLEVLTPLIIAKTLTYFRENSITVNFVRRDFSTDFAKVGKKIQIPIPELPEVKDITPGRQNLNTTDPGNMIFRQKDLSLDHWKGTELELSDEQLDEFIQTGTTEQLELCGVALAQWVDERALLVGGQGFHLAVNVPSPLTDPIVMPGDPNIAVDGRTLLNKHKIPRVARYGAIRPDVGGAFVKSDKMQDASKSNRPDVLADATVGRAAGFDFYETNAIYYHTAGALTSTTLTTPAAGVPVATGAKVESFVAEGTDIVGTLKKGDLFKIAGETYFRVVTEDAVPGPGGTSIVINFAPWLTAPISAGAKAITVFQKTGFRNLLFYRDALAFATRQLTTPAGFTGGNVIQSRTDSMTGITLRLEISRLNKATQWVFDLLCGFTVLRNEAGVYLLDAAV